MLELNSYLILQMVNFLVLLWILNRFLYKPILEIMDKRKGRIKDSEDRVAELEQSTTEKWESYQSKLQEARIEANTEKERIKGEGIEAERSLLEQARSEASKRVEEARSEIQSETDRAKEFLKSQSDAIAQEIARKILGRSLS